MARGARRRRRPTPPPAADPFNALALIIRHRRAQRAGRCPRAERVMDPCRIDSERRPSAALPARGPRHRRRGYQDGGSKSWITPAACLCSISCEHPVLQVPLQKAAGPGRRLPAVRRRRPPGSAWRRPRSGPPPPPRAARPPGPCRRGAASPLRRRAPDPIPAAPSLPPAAPRRGPDSTRLPRRRGGARLQGAGRRRRRGGGRRG